MIPFKIFPTWDGRDRFPLSSLVLPLAILSCSPDTPILSGTPSELVTDRSARQILSSGEFLRLGSSDIQATPEEHPGWIRFGHDYWLDTTEVTQAEFLSLTNRNPAPTIAQAPTKPVVNVTWFDAVVFCNARSKRDHLDTVYEYTALSADTTGSVWALQGLTSHLERTGWRLPSEAEWEYAARAGTITTFPWGELADSAKASEYAWYQRNAGASLHEVARLKPNPWGFYDMAGNAMEWVQDWKGSFPKDTVTEFVGPDVPGEAPEAPLKSGAYNYGLEHLRPSSRSATYAAYRSAKAEYVGFRCARGGFTPTYTNATGQSVQVPPVSVLRTDVARMLGAQSARMVFLNRTNGKGILSWIDYGESSPVVRSLLDADPVFHPVISPDGQWVAWCTAMEGTKGASKIKVRRLTKNDSTVLDLGAGAIPRWWVDGTDTFLVRTGSAMDNTESDWKAIQTTAQRWLNGALTGSVQTWSNGGGYHDGRTGQYLYTGYRRLKQYGISSQTARTLFTYPQSGKAAGDTSQVCNVSAAPDGSGRVMFLDFGYTGKSSVVGRPYGIHEVAFVADSTGEVVKTYPVAFGKSQWDHLEWSNHPRWAVGMALDGNAYKELHLLDLQTGNTTPLVQGTELWMPQLWVGQVLSSNLGVEVDSLFHYDFPEGSPENFELSARLPVYWERHETVQAAALGSSHVGDAIMPREFKSVSMVNLGYAGSQIPDQLSLLRNYVIPHSPRLKFVVLPLMPGWLFHDDTFGILWERTRQSKGGIHDRNHGYWKDGLPSGWKNQIDDFKRKNYPYSVLDSAGGFLEDFGAIGWQTAAPVLSDESGGKDASDPVCRRSLDSLRSLVMQLAARGISTILVAFPQSPGYRNTPLAGRYGPSWSTYAAIKDSVRSWSIPGFVFYDAYLDGQHDYTDVDAQNCDHLSFTGGVKFSRRLDSLIGAQPNR